MIVLAVIASVLEIVTSIRNGTRIDWQGMAIYWAAICGWAACQTERKKNTKE